MVKSTTTATRFLHVTNGSHAAGVIAAAGIPGTRSTWGDPLYEGPVPGGLSDDELMEVRKRYLSGADEDAAVEVAAENDLRRWRQTIAAHESYDELVLWFEHDLFDQLNLIHLLSWIRTHVPRTKAVSLIAVGSFPGHPNFKGLGELSPEELAPLLDTRQPIGDAQYDLAERAWQAFRDPNPEALDAFRRTDTTALPFLAPALERFLQEYPSTRDGLSRTERRLLQLADAGPIGVAAAFPRMHDGEDAYYVTDLSLLDLIDTLSRTSPPLVTSLHGTIHATDAGRDVLAGRRDRVACGLDRWLGGVHLQPGALWRWDDEQRRITRA